MEQNWLTIKNKENNIIITKCSEDAYGDIVIPEGVTIIADMAFEKCNGITSVSIPHSVSNIGSCAFYGCDRLTSINIPDSVTNIGWGAFKDCTSLTDIVINNGIDQCGIQIFEGCRGLKKITIKKGQCGDIVRGLLSSSYGYGRSTWHLDSISFDESIKCIEDQDWGAEISVLDFRGSIPQTNGTFEDCVIGSLRVNTSRKQTIIPADIQEALDKAKHSTIIYAAPGLCKEASSVPGYIKATDAKDDELIDINTQYIMSVKPYELERYTPVTGSIITMVPINREFSHQIVVYEPCEIVLKKIEDAIESLSQKLGGVSGLINLLKFLCEKKMQ